ncbi:hypothetical protein YIM_04480 [Amycolatopsis sp. YIM 10]|nr:hypothetical protein YIM_04480 [Amycolatopsis sp. YIM 10]
MDNGADKWIEEMPFPRDGFGNEGMTNGISLGMTFPHLGRPQPETTLGLQSVGRSKTNRSPSSYTVAVGW